MYEGKPAARCSRVPDLAFGGGLEERGQKRTRATVEKSGTNNDSAKKFIVDDQLLSRWAPCNKVGGLENRGGVCDHVSAVVAMDPGTGSVNVSKFGCTLRTEFLSGISNDS